MGGPWEDYQSQNVETVGPWNDYATPAPDKPAKTGEPSSFGKRMGNIGKIFTTPTPEEVGGQDSESWNPAVRIASSFAKAPGRMFQAGGQVAALGTDYIGHAITSGVKALYEATTPEDAQKAFEGSMRELAGSGAGQSAIAGMKKIQDTYRDVKGAFPETMANVEAAGNYLGVVPVGLGTKAVAGPVIKGAEMIKGAITPVKTLETLDSAIFDTVKAGMNKGIRPTVVGKGAAGQIEKYYENARNAVKTIVEEFPDQLPKDLDSFSTLIKDTKKRMYEKYHSLSEGAEKAGAMTDLTPARNELIGIANAENTPKSVKDAAEKALAETSSYGEKVPPPVAEDLIAHLNSLTTAYWKNPNPNDLRYSTMVERLARNLRVATDDAVQTFGGAEKYTDFKKAYGSLSSIEKDVAHRSVVDARKNVYGLFDLANVATAAEFTIGLATLAPEKVLTAAVMNAVKKSMKRGNDPNRVIEKMFTTVDKQMKKRASLAGEDISRILPTKGPLVASSDVDKMISADKKVRGDIQGDLESGQFGSLLEGKITPAPKSRSLLDDALNSPDDLMATEAGVINTGLEITPAEREAFNKSGFLEQYHAMSAQNPTLYPPSGDEAILRAAKEQGLDHLLGKQPGQPTKFAPVPSTDVRSGVLKGGPYTPKEPPLSVVSPPEIGQPGATSGGKQPSRNKGPENAVTFLQRQGGVKWGESYNGREMRQNPDGKRLSNDRTGMAPDEAAELLNDSGLKHPDGRPWDADRLAEMNKTDNLRNVLTPDKAETKMNRDGRREEAKYYADIEAGFETEGIDAGEIGKSHKNLNAGISETLRAEGIDLPQAIIDAELDDYFSALAKKHNVKGKFTNETGNLAGLSPAQTFSLVNPETQIGRGTLSKKDMTPTETLADVLKGRSTGSEELSKILRGK